jgi:inosine-uridine nucleoside N-ribohydrolase
MHNLRSLVKGPDRAQVLMNPGDALGLGLVPGMQVRVRSRGGAVRGTLAVTDDIMPGVVSLPHGYGHDAAASTLRLAGALPGPNINAITDELFVEPIIGTSILNGVPVQVSADPDDTTKDEPAPAVFDLDIGTDPDDTCVAAMVALHPARFRPALLLTNDETPARGRARFLSHMVRLTGSALPVFAGLPAARPRPTCLVEEQGLVPPVSGAGPASLAVEALLEVLKRSQRVDYFSLGALSNLAAALHRRPDLADRVQLYQMGPALLGMSRGDRPQYNVRLDPPSFLSVFRLVPRPVCVLSQVTWERYAPGGRVQLGLYPDDPLAEALRRSHNPGLRLLAAHLDCWVASGKPCSILHDPLTVLSANRDLIDSIETELSFDASGRAGLALRDPVLTVPVHLSLRADYDAAREAIVTALFADNEPGLAARWKLHNQSAPDPTGPGEP